MTQSSTAINSLYKSGYTSYVARTERAAEELAAQTTNTKQDSVQLNSNTTSSSHGSYQMQLSTEDKRDILARIQDRMLSQAAEESGDGNSTKEDKLAAVKSDLTAYDADSATDEEVESLFSQVQEAMRPPQGAHRPEEGPPPFPPAPPELSGVGAADDTASSSSSDDGSDEDMSQKLFELLTQAFGKDSKQTTSKADYATQLKNVLTDLLGEQDENNSLNGSTYSSLIQKLDTWAEND